MTSSGDGPLASLTPGRVTLSVWRKVVGGRGPITIDPDAWTAVAAGRAAVERIVARGDVVYGINTGFGRLAQTHISNDRLAELQANLVLSHGAGTGALLPDPIVRLVLAVKAVTLARGYSGVRREVIEAL